MSYNNNQQKEPANYLRASSVTKTIHANDNSGKKDKVQFSFEETEEVSYTLTAEKARDLINRLESAMADESGTGGVRVSMYGRKSENKHTGEVFDGLGILVYAQKPPQNGYERKGGSFNNNRGGNNGRRSYPSAPPQQRAAPQGNAPARGGTQQSGQANRGQQTQGSQQAGPTQNAQKNASPSKSGYDEQPDF